MVDHWIVSMTENIKLVEYVDELITIVAATGDLTAVRQAYLAGKEAVKAEAEAVAKRQNAQSGASPANA